MRKSVRSVIMTTLVGILAVGSLAMASPASAGSWGGGLTCPASAQVAGRGTKGGTGPITVDAGYYSFTDKSTDTNKLVTTYSGLAVASWAVSGLGATAGIGFCG